MSSRTNKLPQDQSSTEWLDDHDGHPSRPAGSSVTELPHQQGPPQATSDVETYSEPNIPAGTYKVIYQDHVTFVASGDGKLRIRFAVCDGEHQGLMLSGYYRCQLQGPPKKFGKIKVSKQGDYFDQMCNLFPDLAKGRSDRVSPQRLRGHRIMVEVGTVTTDWSGKQRKPVTQYSKVSKMLSLADCS